MLSSSTFTSKTTAVENEIQQLKIEIRSHMNTVDEAIRAGGSPEEINALIEKEIVLEAALLCLSDKKYPDYLRLATTANPNYNHGWFNRTAELVNDAKRILYELSSAKNIALLPDELILTLMACYLDNLVDIISLAKTTVKYHGLFQNQKNQPLILFRPLLGHAALGEWDAVKKIAARYPWLLDCKGTVDHRHLGRYWYKNRTVKQIALANQEFEIFNELNELANMPLSHEKNQEQFHEIFPDGEITVKYHCDLKKVESLLATIFNAIIRDRKIDGYNLDSMSDNTRKALKRLENYLKPDKYNTCQIGLVFDEGIWLQALKHFEGNLKRISSSWNKSFFWCVKVEEKIAAHLSTGYLRPHCFGIGQIADGRELHGKGCLLSDGGSYDGGSYFNRSDPNFLPGVHFFVGYYSGFTLAGPPMYGASGRMLMRLHLVEELCEAKTRRGTELRDNIRGQKTLQL